MIAQDLLTQEYCPKLKHTLVKCALLQKLTDRRKSGFTEQCKEQAHSLGNATLVTAKDLSK